MARVLAVNISDKKGTIKKSVPSILLREGFGIEGDAHAGDWHRQVSLLDQGSVDKMTAQSARGLKPGIFAENITLEGIRVYRLPLGTRLEINDVLLEVTQIGKECHQHCQIYQQVGMCVMPLEGIFTKVIRGGEIKPGDEIKITPNYRAAVLTISDKGSKGEREDKSGPALVSALEGAAEVRVQEMIPDEEEVIKNRLKALCDSNEVQLILTTGGTGFAPRDVTPEATTAVVEKLVPGIPEAMRSASSQITNRAMLSRAAAGIRGNTLIINLPGSPKAAVECLEVFLPVLGHALETLLEFTYDCGRG